MRHDHFSVEREVGRMAGAAKPLRRGVQPKDASLVRADCRKSTNGATVVHQDSFNRTGGEAKGMSFGDLREAGNRSPCTVQWRQGGLAG